MARRKINKENVDAAAPNPERDEFIWDTELKGFGLRVTMKGVKSYVFQYRTKAGTTRTTIGVHGSPWTPATARKKAFDLLTIVANGGDPVADEKTRQQKAEDLEFSAYLEDFTDKCLKNEWAGSWSLVKRRIELHALPALKGVGLPDIKPAHIVGILDKVNDRPALKCALHAALHRLFSFAVGRTEIDKSPMDNLEAPAAQDPRTRHLTYVEQFAFWRATHRLEYPFGPWYRLLFLTLQRRCEVARLTWQNAQYGERLWLLPAIDAKNEHDHLVPLNDLAVAELDRLGRQSAGLVFTTTGETPISGFSKVKRHLDILMGEELEKIAAAAGDPALATLAPWTNHDLRRTGVTTMQSFGIPIHISSKVLNHERKKKEGVRDIYHLWDYYSEKREALTSWGDHVQWLVNVETVEPIINAERYRRGLGENQQRTRWQIFADPALRSLVGLPDATSEDQEDIAA